MDLRFSILIETYNLTAGGASERFEQTVAEAIVQAKAEGDGEVVVIDVSDGDHVEKLIRARFPSVRVAKTKAISYDGSKMEVALSSSRAQNFIFLDGDCVPCEGWLNEMLKGLVKDSACAGYTRYEGGFMASIASVMDFGYAFPLAERPVKCYSMNNVGFRRETLSATPIPESPLRCNCYAHARLLNKLGTPAVLNCNARVLHEVQPLIRERTRRGFDVIVGNWSDETAPESKFIRLGIFSIPLFVAMTVWLDWQRTISARYDLRLTGPQLVAAFFIFPILRLLDAAGMIVAFVRGRNSNWLWDGLELTSKTSVRRRQPPNSQGLSATTSSCSTI